MWPHKDPSLQRIESRWYIVSKQLHDNACAHPVLEAVAPGIKLIQTSPVLQIKLPASYYANTSVNARVPVRQNGAGCRELGVDCALWQAV
jgi:hypothetical protein